MEKILGLKSYCCSNGEISNFEKYEGLTFVLVFGGHRITAGRGTSSVSNVLLSITIGSPYHSLANTEKLSYLYNKTVHSYIYWYICLYIYMLAIAGQTVGPNWAKEILFFSSKF